jgi:hypothetical protein
VRGLRIEAVSMGVRDLIAVLPRAGGGWCTGSEIRGQSEGEVQRLLMSKSSGGFLFDHLDDLATRQCGPEGTAGAKVASMMLTTRNDPVAQRRRSVDITMGPSSIIDTGRFLYSEADLRPHKKGVAFAVEEVRAEMRGRPWPVETVHERRPDQL